MVVVLIDLAVIGAAWRSLSMARSAQYEEAGRSALNLARVLGENLEGNVHLLDLGLEASASEIAHHRASGPRLDAGLGDHLRLVAGRVGFVDAILIASPEGIVVGGTQPLTGPPIHVADRDYFVRARDGAPGELVVSSPLVSRVDGKRGVAFARRLASPDGGFLGVVLAVVQFERFTRILASVDLGRDGAVVLRDRDNAVVARHPMGPEGEKILGQRRITPELAALVASGRDAATFVAVSPVDGKEKVNAFRRIDGGAFYLLVAASTEQLLTGWRAEVRRTAAGVGLFVLLTALGAALVVRLWARETEQRFRRLVDGAPIPVVLTRGNRLVYANPAFAGAIRIPAPEAAIGRSIADSMTPEDAARVSARFDRLLKGLPVDPSTEVTLRRADGTTFLAAVTDATIATEGGPAILGFLQDVTDQRRTAAERERLIGELKQALADVKTLRGLLPICAHCKKIRDDQGYWSRIETFLRHHSEAEFTHGICPDCAARYFPDDYEKPADEV
jgi:PAS domain S-box-containing protein